MYLLQILVTHTVYSLLSGKFLPGKSTGSVNLRTPATEDLWNTNQIYSCEFQTHFPRSQVENCHRHIELMQSVEFIAPLISSKGSLHIPALGWWKLAFLSYPEAKWTFVSGHKRRISASQRTRVYLSVAFPKPISKTQFLGHVVWRKKSLVAK